MEIDRRVPAPLGRALRAALPRRAALRCLAGGLVAAGLAAVGLDRARAAAQDAPPAAGTGPSLELLTHGIPTIAPGQDLGLVRITFPPGATVPAHTHPGAMAFWVETGTVGWTPIGPDIQVMRAATASTPGPTETVSAGMEAVLRAGDALFVAEPHGEVLVRNAGEGTAVALAAYLFAADQPFITFTNEQGTPPAGTPES